MQNNLSDLIKYQMDQSLSTIREVDILIERNLLTLAINRIYYGMFYILLALALKEGYKTSKHKQLIGCKSLFSKKHEMWIINLPNR